MNRTVGKEEVEAAKMSEKRPTVAPHTVKYNALPERWGEGFPLGNGEIGVMCWSDGKRLKFSLDSAHAWDLRLKEGEPAPGRFTYAELCDLVEKGDFDAIAQARDRAKGVYGVGPTKLHLGRLDLEVDFESCSEFSFSLADAAVHAELVSRSGPCSMDAFVAKTCDLFCIRINPWPESAELILRPFYETSPGLVALNHPELETLRDGKLTVSVQRILPDKIFAICWNAVGPEIYVSIAYGQDEAEVVAEAKAQHPLSGGAGYDKLFKNHAEAWRTFWARSGVVIPERSIDYLWHLGLYILAACARKGSYPPGLVGLWPADSMNPPWRGDYHANVNVQQTFSPAYTTNHLDLVDVWLDHSRENLPKVERLTRDLFGTDGAFFLCTFLPEYTPLLGGYGPVSFAWSNTGWLAQMAWLRWRCSRDKRWLAEKGYPIVRSTFVFYSENLVEEEDGRCHVPVSESPEYKEDTAAAWCKDPNADIATIRKCCDWLQEMEQALGLNELSERAQEVHDKLVPYHLVEFDHPANYVKRSTSKDGRVLGLWKDKPLDYPHRHPSHLLAIYPMMDLTVEGGEDERNLVVDSTRHYLSLGQYAWQVHTYVHMMSHAAVMGKGEMACNFARRYRDAWTLPSGLGHNLRVENGDCVFALMYGNKPGTEPFCITHIPGFTCGICDMLLQGWGDCIRIFPAIPSKWRDLLFVDLLTEGAFSVSALRRDGATRWVRIVAGVDGSCRVRNPFGDHEFHVSGCTPTHRDGLLEWRMSAGQAATLNTSGFENPDLQQEAEAIRKLQVRQLSLG